MTVVKLPRRFTRSPRRRGQGKAYQRPALCVTAELAPDDALGSNPKVLFSKPHVRFSREQTLVAPRGVSLLSIRKWMSDARAVPSRQPNCFGEIFGGGITCGAQISKSCGPGTALRNRFH
jgi:hypothetical protein